MQIHAVPLCMCVGPLYTVTHLFVGNIRPAEEIMANLQHVLADKSAPPSHPLGYLTTTTRDVWSDVREELLAAGLLSSCFRVYI